MLKKKNRLTTKEFDLVFQKGEKNFSNFFLLKVLKKDGEKKISVSISKKVEKKAVNRVLSRRKIYQIIRNNFLDIFENINTVLVVTKPIKGLEKKNLEKEILYILKKAKILK